MPLNITGYDTYTYLEKTIDRFGYDYKPEEWQWNSQPEIVDTMSILTFPIEYIFYAHWLLVVILLIGVLYSDSKERIGIKDELSTL
jgi:hypothetical protein